jgi:hypothetical protein
VATWTPALAATSFNRGCLATGSMMGSLAARRASGLQTFASAAVRAPVRARPRILRSVGIVADPGRPSESEIRRGLEPARIFAEGIVAAAFPVRFALATTPAERTAAFRLRYETVVEEGWADPAEMPDGLERDRFDPEAVHVVGWHGRVPAATARVVFPSERGPLPTEVAFELRVEPVGRVVDVGRGIVATPYRDPAHRVFIALLARCWLEVWARGFRLMCGDAAASLVDGYRGMGFDVTVLGPARVHWGRERFPILIDAYRSVGTAIERISSMRPGPAP